MKHAVHELSFPLVTHMAYFDVRFVSYRILKSGQVAEHILDRLGIQANDHILRTEDVRIMVRDVNEFCRPLTQHFNAYSYTYFQQP
jgi:hypothetical protein